MKKITDNEIIDSLLRGNQNDFALLVERYKDKAFSLLVNILKNREDAEEVLQDAFIKAFNGIKTFRKESKFSTWFYKICYNSALSFVTSKRRKNQKELTSLDDKYDLGKYDDEIYGTAEDSKMFIFKMIEKLPVRSALVVNLFYVDGLSLNEISQVMDLSLVNTKVILHRARNNLRELLLEHNYQEELL